MKITAFLIFLFTLHLSAATHAQNVTLSEHKAPLEKVLNDIRQQSGYVFFYNQDWMQQSKPVDIEVKNLPLADALKASFKDQPFDYAIVNKTIVLKLKEKPTTTPNAPTTPGIITGKVKDGTGQPLVGATVRQKGTENAVTTDEKGAYSLTVPDNSLVTFSYIGYETQEFAVKDIPAGSNIILKAAETNLKEVIVNKGYYNEKAEFSTGDVTTITAKDIEKSPVTNVLQAIEGRVPGMFIQQQTGATNGGYTVQIRGQNSIANGNLPLYVIDGIPYNTPPSLLYNTAGPSGAGNPLNYISPSEIESISVLKDADATAIYGSRGANGVMLITTKKGKAGKNQLDVNVYQGYSNQADPVKLMNLSQYLTVRRAAYANDGITPLPANAYDINGTWDDTRSTNWQKLMTGNTAHTTNATVDFSGGDAKIQYVIGGQYHTQGTVFPGDFNDQSASAHFNISSTSSNGKFKLIFSGLYTADLNKAPSADLSPFQYLAPDTPPIYNVDGSLNWANSTWPLDRNPFAQLLNKYDTKTNNLVSNAVFSYEFIPGLILKSSFGYTNMQLNEHNQIPILSQDPAFIDTETGSAIFSNQNFNTWNIEPELSYDRKIGKAKLSALVGGTLMSNQNEGTNIDGSGYQNDALLGSVNGASIITAGSLPLNQYKYNSLYGRLNYNLEDKYLINITARRDGSSRFGPGKQFANFGSVGAGWIFSNEEWVKDNLPFLSFGKLRGSYGTSGNDQIADYQFLALYSPVPFPYLGVSGLAPNGISNPNYAWEVNKKLEIAVDAGFLQNRISLSLNYYKNNSSNQLLSEPLPLLAGISSIIINLPADVQNTGLEISLNTVNVKSASLTWTSSFNISINKNKLISYPGLATSTYANQFIIGQPLNIRKLYNSIGVDPKTGVYEFVDSKGNLTFNPNYPTDATHTADLNPKFYGGFENTFSYKGFEFSVFLQFVNQLAQNPLFQAMAPGRKTNNNLPAAYIGNYWNAPGDIAKYEQPTSSNATAAYTAYNYAQSSNLAIMSGSYVRVQNLTFSYNIPRKYLNNLHIPNLKIFVQGQNLFTFTGFKSDPEVPNLNTLAPLRTLAAGLQFSFN